MSIFHAQKPALTRITQDFIDALAEKNDPPLYTLSPEEARQVLLTAQSGRTSRPDAETLDRDLPVGPTGKVKVRLVKPKGAKDKLPCIFYFHGGGWVMGDMQTHDRLVRELAVSVGAAVVFVQYDPSPEAQYPVPLEQAYAAIEHVASNAAEFGIDPDGFVVAGDSVGGNMATVMAMFSRERGGPKIIFQLLFYPVTGADFDTGSYKEFADGPWLTRKAMQWFWDQYSPDAAKRKDRHAAPILADDSELAGLPPALVITAENDVLRDEGEAYARRLDAAGVKAASVRFNGTIHDFVMLDALAESTPARAALVLAAAEVKNAFQGIFPEKGFGK